MLVFCVRPVIEMVTNEVLCFDARVADRAETLGLLALTRTGKDKAKADHDARVITRLMRFEDDRIDHPLRRCVAPALTPRTAMSSSTTRSTSWALMPTNSGSDRVRR